MSRPLHLTALPVLLLTLALAGCRTSSPYATRYSPRKSYFVAPPEKLDKAAQALIQSTEPAPPGTPAPGPADLPPPAIPGLPGDVVPAPPAPPAPAPAVDPLAPAAPAPPAAPAAPAAPPL